MTLRLLFAIPIVVILLVTLSLAGMIVSQEWAGHQRGKIAIAAAEQADVLNRLEGEMAAERIITWDAFEADYPLPEAVARRVADARAETDRALATLIANSAAHPDPRTDDAEPYLPRIQASLLAGRQRVDEVLNLDRPNRTYEEFLSIMPRMLGPATLLWPRLARTADLVIKAEPELAGIFAVARIGLVLRAALGDIAAVTLPRMDAGEPLSDDDLSKVATLQIQADATAKLLDATFYLANPTDEMRDLLASAKAIREGIVQRQLDLIMDANARSIQGARVNVWSSRPVAIWADHINALRNAIMRETLTRVRASQASRDRRLDTASAAVGAVTLIIISVLVMLRRRVVGPLAQLGFAITRIADGDRRTKLVIRSTTREIATMVTAVETLRQAALIADADALRQREAAERRLGSLREALGILRAVNVPSLSLDREVAGLSEGIDTMVAFVTALPAAMPPTLADAAVAVRSGLRDMREVARALVATDVMTQQEGPDALSETEIVARIVTVRAHIDRREELVRAFLQPCLLALRDTTPLANSLGAATLHDLIGEQFELIEATVATLASMRAAALRAAEIVRDLSPEVSAPGAIPGDTLVHPAANGDSVRPAGRVSFATAR